MTRLAKIRNKVDRKRALKREKNSRSMKRRQSFADRRAMRQSELGRKNEDRVENLLKKKLQSNELLGYERYAPNSLKDSEGKDFGVTQKIENQIITAEFGITISPKCLQEHQMKHPDVPCILIPPEMSDDRIWWRICQIAKENKTARA